MLMGGADHTEPMDSGTFLAGWCLRRTGRLFFLKYYPTLLLTPPFLRTRKRLPRPRHPPMLSMGIKSMCLSLCPSMPLVVIFTSSPSERSFELGRRQDRSRKTVATTTNMANRKTVTLVKPARTTGITSILGRSPSSTVMSLFSAGQETASTGTRSQNRSDNTGTITSRIATVTDVRTKQALAVIWSGLSSEAKRILCIVEGSRNAVRS